MRFTEIVGIISLSTGLVLIVGPIALMSAMLLGLEFTHGLVAHGFGIILLQYCLIFTGAVGISIGLLLYLGDEEVKHLSEKEKGDIRKWNMISVRFSSFVVLLSVVCIASWKLAFWNFGRTGFLPQEISILPIFQSFLFVAVIISLAIPIITLRRLENKRMALLAWSYGLLALIIGVTFHMIMMTTPVCGPC